MKKYILFTLLAVLSLVGCVKDDTVHDFKTLNEITISGLEDSYGFNYLEEVSVIPTVTVTNAVEDNLEYRWYMFTTTSRFEADTLSKEKDFKVIMTAPPAEDYTLVFSVKDVSTGIVTKKEMASAVYGPLSKGWVVIAEQAGQKVINFAKEDQTVLYDVFANSNAGISLQDPYMVRALNPNDNKPQMKNVSVFSKNEDGGFILNPNSFKVTGTFRDAFYQVPAAAELNVNAFQNFTFTEYLMVNGKVHTRSVSSGDPIWRTPLIIIEGESSYEMAPSIGDNTYQGVYFDNLHSRILFHSSYNLGYLSEISDIGAKNLNFTASLIQRGGVVRSPETASSYFVIGHDNNDPSKIAMKSFLLGLRPPYNFYDNGTLVFPEANYPGLYASTMMQSGYDALIRGILWYSDGKKLYAMNTQAAEPTEVVIRDFEAEGIIVDTMRMIPYVGSFNRTYYYLALAVRNTNLTENQAGILVYQGGTVGGINIAEVESIYGLGDKIIDFDQKLN
ncbi:PKD-like family lipoprotein [Aestuariibaculum sp. M13]|uniref:PKD-like family lipoprotein n=1 Tax=Aestuariibaculum sp. M13 TaxID=2967132 RepID=UPI002159CA4F|nr:PKD-like family lipoprotein [Aestuariibaculum sp. M13]MCR8668933.1 PKD-like family lipoprotein [Aestuariibaculum sp. M13]